MEGIIALIIQLISGAVGGNVAGALLKKLSLGTVGNSIVGILGGGIGGLILGALGMGGAAAAGAWTLPASSAASRASSSVVAC